MQRRAIRIGKPGTLKFFYVFLILWGLIVVGTIIMAVAALPLTISFNR
jgi:1,4-dihydroxy-2-naphthoate octaprenyltransferase